MTKITEPVFQDLLRNKLNVEYFACDKFNMCMFGFA